MKIGILWENFEVGGVTTHIESLINDKTLKNYEFTIFTNKTNKAAKILKKKVSKHNVGFKYYNSLNAIYFKNFFLKIFFFIFRPFLFLVSIIQFYNLLKRLKFDILLCQCGGYGDFRSELSGIFASSILNFPTKILLIHHSFTKPLLWNFLLRILDIFIKKNIDGIIFVSKATKKNIYNYTNLYSNKIIEEVIYNGVNILKLKKNNKKLDRIFKTKNCFKVGMLSRIELNKGHEVLINAFEELPDDIKKKIRVFFIGSGSIEYLNKLKKNLKEKNLEKYFRFTGYIDTESSLILKKLDLLVSLTKDFEGFGLSIAEALAVKTPVLATKVGGSIEFLNNKNSSLIKPNNQKELRFFLIEFVQNYAKIKKKSMIGKKLIYKSFNSKKMAQNYKKFFIKCRKTKEKNV